MSGLARNGASPEGGDPGYTGSRIEAIESGRIIDVSELAEKAGFRWHVAMTQVVWNECVKWDRADSTHPVFQAERLRLIDVLRSCVRTIRLKNPETSLMTFSVSRIPSDGSSDEPVQIGLEIVAHLGDEGEPVLTIALASESDA